MKKLLLTFAAFGLAVPGALFADSYSVFRVCEDQHVLRTSDGIEAGTARCDAAAGCASAGCVQHAAAAAGCASAGISRDAAASPGRQHPTCGAFDKAAGIFRPRAIPRSQAG